MTRAQRLELLKQIEEDIYVCSLESTFLDDAKSCAIHEVIEELEQEPQSFKWCTDCKEYNQEKHCCHRYSKVIRNTVAEIKQEPKTGQWIIYNYPGHECVYCSSCKEEYYEEDLYIGGSDFPKYCPNCGCRMVEPQESEG